MVNLSFLNKETGKKFRIVRWNKETGEVTLKGENSTFTEKFDKDKFKRMGYTLVQDEAPPEPKDDNDA